MEPRLSALTLPTANSKRVKSVLSESELSWSHGSSSGQGAIYLPLPMSIYIYTHTYLMRLCVASSSLSLSLPPSRSLFTIPLLPLLTFSYAILCPFIPLQDQHRYDPQTRDRRLVFKRGVNTKLHETNYKYHGSQVGPSSHLSLRAIRFIFSTHQHSGNCRLYTLSPIPLFRNSSFDLFSRKFPSYSFFRLNES